MAGLVVITYLSLFLELHLLMNTQVFYCFICCLIYVECFSMMITFIAYILMNVHPDSKSSNWCTSTFCVHMFFVLFLCFRSMITLSSWLTKICACFGVWLNSFMLCELDKCFYDFIGSWITLFVLHEGFWQVSVWFRMKIWDTDILPYFILDIFFSLELWQILYFSVMEVHIHIHRVAVHLPCHANAKFYILTLTDVEDHLLPQACSLNNLSIKCNDRSYQPLGWSRVLHDQSLWGPKNISW